MSRTSRHDRAERAECGRPGRGGACVRDRGAEHPEDAADAAHAWAARPCSEWTREQGAQLLELSRRMGDGTSCYRVDLGQVGDGDGRVFWAASFPLPCPPHRVSGARHAVALGYARGSARAVERELLRRGWLEPLASRDLARLEGVWPRRAR